MAFAARRRVAAFLFLLSFGTYLANLRFVASGDTRPARVLPFSILREGDLDLNELDWIAPPGYNHYYVQRDAGGNLWSAYPIFPGLVATPVALPVLGWLAWRDVPDDSVTFRLATAVVERVAAALIAAASVSVLFLAAGLISRSPIALAAALVYAFGTNTWAISSQALWQHGPAQLCLCAMSLCLLGTARPRRMMAAGVWAGLAVAARPTMVIFAIAALIFVWRDRRKLLLPFLLGPIVIGTALLIYNLNMFGRLSGGYGTEKLALPSLSRLAGLLASPSRGLLIYSPVVLLALPGVVGRYGAAAGWLTYLAAASVGYVIFMSCYVNWWAGQCWGPRYLTDVLPGFALLAAAGAESVMRRRWVRIATVVLIAWSVMVQAIGTYWDDRSWDQLPVPIEQQPQRVWQWSDPQILRAARGEWHGADLAPLLWQTIVAEEDALLRPLSEANIEGRVNAAMALPERSRAGARLRIDVQVHNDGSETWPAFSSVGPLHVGLLQRWWCGGELRVESAGFTPLRRNLAARQSDRLNVALTVPDAIGACEVELRILQFRGPNTGLASPGALRFALQVD